MTEVLVTMAYSIFLFVWAFINTTDLEGHALYLPYRSGALAVRSEIVQNAPYVQHALIIQHVAKMTQIPTIPRGTVAQMRHDRHCPIFHFICFSLHHIRAHAYELFFYVYFAIVLNISTFLVCTYFHTRYDALTHCVYPCFIIWGLDHLIRILRLVVFNFGFTSQYTMNATAEFLSDDFIWLRLRSRLTSTGRPGKLPILPYRPPHAFRLKPTNSPLQVSIQCARGTGTTTTQISLAFVVPVPHSGKSSYFSF
ncbi:hypothetical protein M405DRAFT_846850 [Rhizopogon salebrosus TDB-379]|nr:hypothetical protein M405DRAFT_846850 [Rhizopogon salebrosus TDB-379]